jgi:acyl-coenzyme A thioesterase PaaI-like protein
MIETSSAANPSLPAIRFDHACFGCGDANPIGLHLQFSPLADGVTASFTPEPAHQGFDNVIHGGIISTVLDEAMAWATTQAGVWAVTAEISVRFKNPLAVGEPATVTARVTENRGRIVTTAADLTRNLDNATIATATATFVRVSDTLAAEWQRRYLETTDVTEIAIGSPGSPRERVTATGEQSR